MAYAWLDAPPRRRLRIPSRDLALGVAMGVGLCALALGLAASMELEPPAPEEPVTISVGVLGLDAPTGGRGGARREGSPGRPRARPRAATPDVADPSAAEASATAPGTAVTGPMGSGLTSSTRPRGPRGPSPTLPALPGLGDLMEPIGESGGDGEGEGGSPGGATDDDGNGDGNGSGSGDGSGNGAVAAYRSQLAAWLSARFHVEGSGLSPAALKALRVRASLELSDDRVVVDYDLEPTGTDVIDEAARRALDSVLGHPTPEPPPGYGAVQRRIRVTFVCRPSTCS